MAVGTFKRTIKLVGATGLLPITTDSKTDRFQICKTRLAINVIATIVSLLTVLHQLIYYREYENDTLSQYIMYIYWCMMNGFACMAAHILAMKNRRKICEFCNNLIEKIQEITELTGRKPETRLWIYITFGEIAALFVITSDYPLWAYRNLGEYLVVNLAMIVVIHLGVLNLIISAVLRQISQAFREKMAKTADRNIVQHYCSTYHDVFELNREFCNIFGTVSLIFISHMFIMLIIATYSSLKDVEFQTTEETLTYFILIGWIIYAFAAIIFLIYPCVTANRQAGEIAATVYKTLAKTRNQQVAEQLMKFSTLLQYETINFAPYNLFPFTYSLVLQICGSSISYIIILNQFDQPKFDQKNFTDYYDY